METLTVLDITGAIVGLFYLYLEYKASILLWIVGIIMPTIYIYTYYEAGLYADFALNIYYLLAAIYGFIYWQVQKHKTVKGNIQNNKHGADKSSEISVSDSQVKDMPITRTPHRLWLILIAISLLSWIAITALLIKYTDSNVPVIDGFINALSIIALWMLAKKFVEQWLVWIIVDAVAAALYLYKGLPFTCILYAVNTMVAIAGYFKWKKEIVTAV